MSQKFTVTSLQQGRFIDIKGPNLNVELTRSEAFELSNLIRNALTASDPKPRNQAGA